MDYTVHFMEYHSRKERKIDENMPELRFMKAICQGSGTAEEYFNEYTVYRKQVFIDVPKWGRCEGSKEIQKFMDNWLTDFEAVSAEVHPVIQTIANGRSVSEIEVWFTLKDHRIKRVPMSIFADLAPCGKMEGLRIYYYFKFLPGGIAYRKPIFRPNVMKPAEPALMTDVMRYYYEQLHNFREEALDNILNMCTDDCIYGGYRPDEEEAITDDKETIRKHYTAICTLIPHLEYIRFETITDDGVMVATEWTSVIRPEGLKFGLVSVAGCAIYERDGNGKLSSIRINDNTGYDQGIDLNVVPASDLYVDM